MLSGQLWFWLHLESAVHQIAHMVPWTWCGSVVIAGDA
jgi:hypothetical protein